MSGSGGGGGNTPFRPISTSIPKSSGDGTGSASRPDVCSIFEETVLNSPVAAVLSRIRVGDNLDIHFNPGPPQRLEVLHANEVAGSITSPSMSQIIECINNGWGYQAIVISISQGRCRIRIEPQ